MQNQMEKAVFMLDDKCRQELKSLFARYGYRYILDQQVVICAHCGLPLPLQLSHDQGLTRSCAFKEFRFQPPYVSKRKASRKKKKLLPPIPEHMLPRRHSSLEEEELDTHIPPLPSLTISPAFLTDRVSVIAK